MADAAPPVSPPAPMDEILASIRRIITEEPPLGGGPATGDADADSEDVLELGEPIEPPGAGWPPGAAAAGPPLEPAPDDGPDALLSGPSQAASQRALATLAELTVDPNAAVNTLDGLVREMLRPMLRDWLDANLPDMVERMVAREVARLSGR